MNPNFQPTTPVRVLGTAFQPSPDRPCYVSYTVEISISSTLLGTANRQVTLLSDASNPPVTARASTRNQLSGVLATNLQRSQLSYLVPKGHFVSVNITGTTGTGSVTMAEQVEEIL
jgi:hypothetical protein